MESIGTTKPNEFYDIAIIGGGINGAGIVLEAATRGFSTLLIEKGDFGNFTTSASTKLIHGGLRYLEYYEFPLVRESLRERERLLKNAPHLVRPLKLNIPQYKNSKRHPLIIKMGMLLYDVFSFDKSMPNHSMTFSDKKLNFIEPGLRHKDLRALASYYDCIVEYPERLCIEIVLSAEKAGAFITNYSQVTDCKNESGKYKILFNDVINNKQYTVNSRFLINATGPFVDLTNKLFDKKKFARLMGGTKGSHILIDRFNGGPKEALYIEAHQDSRPFFIIPWKQYYLVGTTDKFYDGNLDKVSMEEDEKEYLINELNYFFEGNLFSVKDIRFTYSGVRPLPYEPGKKESRVTRKHIIIDHSKDGLKNYYSIVGGKLTTYRNLAEDTIDIICEKENLNRKSETRKLRLIGSEKITYFEDYLKSAIPEFSTEYRIPESTAEYLIRFYGSRVRDVLELTIDNPMLKEKVSNYSEDIKAQIVFALRKEHAKNLEDILIRRTGLGYSEHLGLDCIKEVANIAAPFLNWSEEQKKSEIEKYITKVQYFYQPKQESLEKFKEVTNAAV